MNELIQRIEHSDGDQVKFRCAACSWDSGWIPINEAQSSPPHDCKPGQPKAVLI